ncbi:hypothetical protein ACHAP5_000438 [Fusarium lateritium]
MSTNKQAGTAEPVDKETIRKKINEMKENIAQLYAMSDKLDEGIAKGQKLLDNLRKKRMKKHQHSAKEHAPMSVIDQYQAQHGMHHQLPQITPQIPPQIPPHNQNMNALALQFLTQDMPIVNYMDSNVQAAFLNGDM